MSRFVMSSDVPTEKFDWGAPGCAARPPGTGCASFVVMDVTLDPGFFHAFHKHPDQDEMIIVKSRADRAVARAASTPSSARATPSTSTRTSCTARTTTSTRPPSSRSSSRPRSATAATSRRRLRRGALGLAAADAGRPRPRGRRARATRTAPDPVAGPARSSSSCVRRR